MHKKRQQEVFPKLDPFWSEFGVSFEFPDNIVHPFEGSQLFHVVTSTLNSIPWSDAICHQFKNSGLPILELAVLSFLLRLDLFFEDLQKNNIFLLFLNIPAPNISVIAPAICQYLCTLILVSWFRIYLDFRHVLFFLNYNNLFSLWLKLSPIAPKPTYFKYGLPIRLELMNWGKSC